MNKEMETKSEASGNSRHEKTYLKWKIHCMGFRVDTVEEKADLLVQYIFSKLKHTEQR